MNYPCIDSFLPVSVYPTQLPTYRFGDKLSGNERQTPPTPNSGIDYLPSTAAPAEQAVPTPPLRLGPCFDVTGGDPFDGADRLGGAPSSEVVGRERCAWTSHSVHVFGEVVRESSPWFSGSYPCRRRRECAPRASFPLLPLLRAVVSSCRPTRNS